MLTTSLWLAEQYSSPKVLLHYRATIWRVQLADDDNRAQKYIVTRPQRMIGSEVVREEERERCVTCLFRCERERLLADATGWKRRRSRKNCVRNRCIVDMRGQSYVQSIVRLQMDVMVVLERMTHHFERKKEVATSHLMQEPLRLTTHHDLIHGPE
jgi:hypothetical protein